MNGKTTEINDIRLQNEFTYCSFSGHKKKEVQQELIHNMKLKKLDSCAHWVAELLCAGHFSLLWEIILFYLAKYINVGNPKIPIYILMRFGEFKSIFQRRDYIQELDLRNNSSLRFIFTEIICFMAMSNKKPAFEPIVSLKQSKFNLEELSTQLHAPPTAIDKIADLLRDDDPHELFVIFTEIAYYISSPEHYDLSSACYWIDWLVQYQYYCIKQKTPIVAFRRTKYPVEFKFQTNAIWIVWDIFLMISESTPLLHKTVVALMELFCIQYKPSSCIGRKQILFFVVSLITENIDFNIPIVNVLHKDKVDAIVAQLDKYYLEVKRNEITPKTDYMFMNIKDQSKYNLKMGIAKMQLLAKFEDRL